jgi:hypothetical protein
MLEEKISPHIEKKKEAKEGYDMDMNMNMI